MNCRYLKKKLANLKNNQPNFECKLTGNKTTYLECKNCLNRNFTSNKHNGMRTKSEKLKTLEKNRYSIITTNMLQCYVCGRKAESLHEVFGGKNRVKSMEYGLVVPLCIRCHRYIEDHEDAKLQLKKKGQSVFLEKYNLEKFIKEFGQDYTQREERK